MMKLNEHNLSLKADIDAEYEEYCEMEAEGRFETAEELLEGMDAWMKEENE